MTLCMNDQNLVSTMRKSSYISWFHTVHVKEIAPDPILTLAFITQSSLAQEHLGTSLLKRLAFPICRFWLGYHLSPSCRSYSRFQADTEWSARNCRLARPVGHCDLALQARTTTKMVGMASTSASSVLPNKCRERRYSRLGSRRAESSLDQDTIAC